MGPRLGQEFPPVPGELSPSAELSFPGKTAKNLICAAFPGDRKITALGMASPCFVPCVPSELGFREGWDQLEDGELPWGQFPDG